MGCVAVVPVIHGRNQSTDDARQAAERSRAISSNIRTWRARAMAGVAIRRAEKRTDPKRTAAIGYRLGGSRVQPAYPRAGIQGVISLKLMKSAI